MVLILTIAYTMVKLTDFESFIISFVRENLFSESFYYSNNYLYPNTSNYLIGINWTFNE